MNYVDGFLLAVPTANKAAYQEMAAECATYFRKNGALAVAECWGEDVPEGKVTSFPMAVKLKPDESVVFSWIIWPSKAARTSGMEASMKDIEASGMMGGDLFDGQRMIFGGFDVIVDA